jgi:hypothetical protein
MVANPVFLDLLSTSHEKVYFTGEKTDEMCLSGSLVLVPKPLRCVNHAPFICYVDHVGKAHLVQGCCNSWTCPKCGNKRAKQEYGRMVQGAKMLEERGFRVFMHTWTCRGKELSASEAERDYGRWTNLMLNACRDRARSEKTDWTYVQVTERQKRAHPHSHIITSFIPSDAVLNTVKKWGKSGKLEDRAIYTSEWYEKRLKSAGLGSQYEITEVRSLTGCAVYCAKYLFKDCMFTEWPPKWKRIRYAQSWPKNPDHKTPEIAFAIVKYADWRKVDELERRVYADSIETLEVARAYGQLSVTYK